MNHIEKTFNVAVTITDNLNCCSVTESCPTLHDPMDCSSSGFPVVQCLLEFAQIHGHWVDDAIQLSNPLPPSTFVFKSFPHQGLFQWVFESMLAACCWITNYPKLLFKSLSIYYFTKFCGWRIQEQLSCVILVQGLSWGCTHDPSQDCNCVVWARVFASRVTTHRPAS